MRRELAARWLRISSAAALLVTSTAVAQTGGDAPQSDEPAGAAPLYEQGQCPSAPDESVQGPARSEALLRRFRCLFDAREYHACLPVLDEACKLTDAPRCLYSKAVVHHALYHCELAVSYYEAYLSRDPYDSVRDEAVSALTELRRICGQPAPAPVAPSPIESAIQPLGEQATPDPPSPAPAVTLAAAPGTRPLTHDSPSSARKVLAFATLGAGAATAVATAVFASSGQRAEADFEARSRGKTEPDDEARALDDNGKRYNTLAWVFLGGSVALLGTSVTLFVLDAQAQESVGVSTDGAFSVRYRGSF
jgi:hypothetical protein